MRAGAGRRDSAEERSDDVADAQRNELGVRLVLVPVMPSAMTRQQRFDGAEHRDGEGGRDELAQHRKRKPHRTPRKGRRRKTGRDPRDLDAVHHRVETGSDGHDFECRVVKVNDHRRRRYESDGEERGGHPLDEPGDEPEKAERGSRDQDLR